MSFDRSDRFGDGLTGPVRRAEAQPGRVAGRAPDGVPDGLGDRGDVGNADGREGAGRAKPAPRRVPTREEQIAAYWRNRRNVDAAEAAYAAEQRTETPHAERPPARPHTETQRAATTASADRDDADQADNRQPPDGSDGSDKPSPGLDLLFKRVAELEAGREADKAADGRRIAELEAKVSELGAENAELRAEVAGLRKDVAGLRERQDRSDAYAGQMTTAIRELRQGPDEPGENPAITGRTGDGVAKRAERQETEPRRLLPRDTVNNAIAVTAGGIITDLGYHLHDLTPEAAGIGASALAIGAGVVAVVREYRSRRGHDDADH